ncbi:MAG TPA: hypothetical protein VFW50_07080 [Streptosporangiaceae bacterium]|nr:hypothetical protein [Streptosporangiaceae bacterium]
MPDFLISSGHEQEKDIAANLQQHMFLMTVTVLLTAALLRGLIASIAPVAGQVGRGLDMARARRMPMTFAVVVRLTCQTLSARMSAGR